MLRFSCYYRLYESVCLGSGDIRNNCSADQVENSSLDSFKKSLAQNSSRRAPSQCGATRFHWHDTPSEVCRLSRQDKTSFNKLLGTKPPSPAKSMDRFLFCKVFSAVRTFSTLLIENSPLFCHICPVIAMISCHGVTRSGPV